MIEPEDTSSIKPFWRSSRAVQAAWLLFALLALSLALPGMAAYRQWLEAEVSQVGQPAQYADGIFLAYIFTSVLMLLLAIALITRKPGQPAAVFGAFALTAAITSTFAQMLVTSQVDVLPAARFVLFIQLSTLTPFLCLAPDGQFHPPWLRWVAFALVPMAAAAVLLIPNPVASIGVSILIGAVVIANLLAGYHQLAGSPKQEAAAWTLASVVLFAGAQGIGFPVRLLPLPSFAFANLYSLMGSFTPLIGLLMVVAALTCLAVALLGDELFRVEVAINRAIVYGLLSLFVVGGYVLVVGYLSLIFQSSGSLWLSLVATGVIAALFQPIRHQVQRLVNRIIYGEREDPYTVLAQLGQRLEIAIASDEVIPMILQTVREAMKVTYVAIDLRLPETEEFKVTAEIGRRGEAPMILPLVYRNEQIGQLRVGYRDGEHGFTRADRRLLDGLAQQAGAAIHAARQNVDLKIARERLVVAQEEERRRIRRDLHDGLGAGLAALNLQAGEVQRLISSDPENANRRMVDLRAGLREAIGDTRRLVYGLRPPALDELGLLGAMRSRIDSYESSQPGEPNGSMDDNSQPLALCLDAPEQLPPLPAAVEVAIYRIVDEGLANIVRHARAKNGLVRISIEDQGLMIEVSDDGIGLPEGYRHGVGLHSMRERTVELGGRWSIQTKEGHGASVRAWLPLANEGQQGATWTKPASLS